jgi:hypothetical protein
LPGPALAEDNRSSSKILSTDIQPTLASSESRKSWKWFFSARKWPSGNWNLGNCEARAIERSVWPGGGAVHAGHRSQQARVARLTACSAFVRARLRRVALFERRLGRAGIGCSCVAVDMGAGAAQQHGGRRFDEPTADAAAPCANGEHASLACSAVRANPRCVLCRCCRTACVVVLFVTAAHVLVCRHRSVARSVRSDDSRWLDTRGQADACRMLERKVLMA